MAGANNAQMKAAGWRARDITKARAEHSRLSHAAMTGAGYQPKKFSHAAKTIGASKRAARPAGQSLDEYRQGAASRHQSADEAHRALRGQIREQVKRTNEARGKASAMEPTQRRGPIPRDEIQANVAARTETAKLQALLRTRDAIARGRRAAATPGQGDLFGTPAPARGPSPFRQRVDARNAALARAGERAAAYRGNLRDVAGRMLAGRKATSAQRSADLAPWKNTTVGGKSSTEWSARMTELQRTKPRALNKLYRNPALITPEIKAKHDGKMREWNREYRVATKSHKQAMELSNAAWRSATPRQQAAYRTATYGG